MTDETSVAVVPVPAQEKALPSTTWLIWRDVSGAVGGVLQAAVFIAVVCLVIVAIGEMSGRDALMSMVDARLNSVKADIVADSQVIRPQSESNDVVAARLARHKELAQLEKARHFIRAIVAFGGVYPEQLSVVGRQLADLSSVPEFPKPIVTSGVLQLLSSDQLLAVVVLGAGAIGAMISMMRSRRDVSFAPLIHGLAAGFTAYLVIRGGKHIFLVPMAGEITLFNPYGGAFAGLLAGLFTEKAHALLAFLVDDWIDRIRAVSKHAVEKKPEVSPGPPL